MSLGVTVNPEGISWALWQAQQGKAILLGLWSQLWKGTETPHSPIEQRVLGMYKALQ